MAAEILKLSAPNRSTTDKSRDRPNLRASSDESREVVVTLPKATEWHYRGRAGHELGAIQPLSAPSGLVAQKDEGFQKFYKAVASPTHVRVTAGGRIVPNTRGPQSPNVKKETASEQSNAQPQQSTPANISSTQEVTQAATPFPVPLGYPTAFAGYPAGMFAHAQFPFPQIPLGFNLAGVFSLPHLTTNRHVSTQSESPVQQLVSHTQGLDGAGGVRISPPGQFDPTRPYFVNGQWMLPLGAQAYPYGLHPFAGPSGLMGQSGGTSMPQGQMPPQANSYVSMEAQPAQSNASHVRTNISVPTHPPISSIRPSQITKCHIESLKYNLKRVEDQLQYNIHQIDVKHMEGLAKEIRASVKALQDALPKQLEFEEMHYPKAEKQEPKPNGELFNPPISQSSGQRDHVPQVRRNGTASRVGVAATKHTRAAFSTGSDLPGSGSTDSEPLRRFSGLPMAAAAAAPFRPSNRHTIPNHTTSSADGGSSDSKEAVRIRLLCLGTKSFQAMAVNLAGGNQKQSTCSQPKTTVNGFTDSPTHGMKSGASDSATPKSTTCSVTTMPLSVDQEDGHSVSEGSKRVRVRCQEGHSIRKGNDLWHSMLKKGSPSSNVLPGEVTSMTAQGYLPQYGGHAAASLTPTIRNTVSSRGSLGKVVENEAKLGSAVPASDQRGENRPPVGDLPVDPSRTV
ncbi:uncharacterized protein DNG_08354 [Cephalotrichum gorgonifer]|uniref:Uncharacterized protein n=1 Tax=Cephalotrichum gorgonifer TaxID=2041049 RepID=A0AAE8N6A7_9PEZI|nr:uncharacterized protein DNG_08354 [Cephalotrichum gorgonifer]